MSLLSVRRVVRDGSGACGRRRVGGPRAADPEGIAHSRVARRPAFRCARLRLAAIATMSCSVTPRTPVASSTSVVGGSDLGSVACPASRSRVRMGRSRTAAVLNNTGRSGRRSPRSSTLTYGPDTPSSIASSLTLRPRRSRPRRIRRPRSSSFRELGSGQRTRRLCALTTASSSRPAQRSTSRDAQRRARSRLERSDPAPPPRSARRQAAG